MKKRKYQRAETNFQVWYQTLGERNISHGRPRSKNISENGILLSTSEAVRLGAKVLVKFKIPNYDDVILAEGKIARTDKVNDDIFDIGIEFQSMQDDDAMAIEKYVLEKL